LPRPAGLHSDLNVLVKYRLMDKQASPDNITEHTVAGMGRWENVIETRTHEAQIDEHSTAPIPRSTSDDAVALAALVVARQRRRSSLATRAVVGSRA
jgi:hypothetical protein